MWFYSSPICQNWLSPQCHPLAAIFMTSQALLYCNKDGRSDVWTLKNYFVTPPLQNLRSAPAVVHYAGLTLLPRECVCSHRKWPQHFPYFAFFFFFIFFSDSSSAQTIMSGRKLFIKLFHHFKLSVFLCMLETTATKFNSLGLLGLSGDVAMCKTSF